MLFNRANGKCQIIYRVYKLFQKMCVVFALLILSILMLTTGCAFSYKDAVNQDTPDAYMKFIELNPKSKNCLEARQRLHNFFHKANIKRIMICYLSFNYTGPNYYNAYDIIKGLHESQNLNYGSMLWDVSIEPLVAKEFTNLGLIVGPGPNYYNVYGISVLNESQNLKNYGSMLWDVSIEPLVAKELTNKGYIVQFGAELHTDFYTSGYFPPQLHSKTSQSDSIIESTSDILDGTLDRMTPDFYLAAEPFLKSSTWPNIDGVLLVTLPVVRHALTWNDIRPYPTPYIITADISSMAITYHLFDVKSKRRVFAGYLCYIDRATKWGETKITGTIYSRTHTTSWRFVESEDAFFSRVVNSLFEKLPINATGE